MINICFKGSQEYSSSIIDVLESLGGINELSLKCESDLYYHNINGIIDWSYTKPDGYTEVNIETYVKLTKKRIELKEKVTALNDMKVLAGKYFPEILPLIRKELQEQYSLGIQQDVLEKRFKLIGK